MAATHRVNNHPGIYWYLTAAGKRRYAVSTPVAGKQKWAQGFATVAEAEEAKARMRGSGAPASMTVQAYMEGKWFPTVTGARQTLLTYRANVRHIVRHLGKVRLAKLEPWDMESFKSALEKEGLAAKTRHDIFATLRQALKQAVRWKLLSYNPAGVDYVDGPGFQKRIPSITQLDTDTLVRRLKDMFIAAEREGMGLMVELTVLTGMREKEMFGLEWGHIDMANALLSIPRANTKTDAGARKVALDDGMVERLRIHRLEQMRDWGVQKHVFTRNGKRWTPTMLYPAWQRVKDAVEMPDLHFHDLRHVQGSLLARLKVNPKVAQERLGHADISTTLGIYSHVNVEDQREAAAAVAELFRREG